MSKYIMHTNPNFGTLDITFNNNRLKDVGHKKYAFKQFLNYTYQELVDHFKNEVDKVIPEEIIIEKPRRELRLSRIKDELSDPIDHDILFDILVETSVPIASINPKVIDPQQMPNREFRDAWCDVTPEAKIDIDLVKAKEIQLEKLRVERQQAFVDLGFPQKISPEIEEAILSQPTKEKLQALRDVTEPLKSLVVEGYNDAAVLQQIRDLGKLNV